MFLDKSDNVAHRLYLLHLLVVEFDPEFVLHRDEHLHYIQAVRLEVGDEVAFGRDLRAVDPQQFADHRLNFFKHIIYSPVISIFIRLCRSLYRIILL